MLRYDDVKNIFFEIFITDYFAKQRDRTHVVIIVSIIQVHGIVGRWNDEYVHVDFFAIRIRHESRALITFATIFNIFANRIDTNSVYEKTCVSSN